MARKLTSIKMDVELKAAVEEHAREMRRNVPAAVDVSFRAALEDLVHAGLESRRQAARDEVPR